MGSDIICFGEAMVELSAIQDGSCRIGVGGDTFNTAVYLARAGHDVSYATAVGDCPFSAKLIESLETEGISPRLAPAIEGRSLGLYAIDVDPHGERSFTYWRSQSAVRSLLHSPFAEYVLNAMRKAGTLYLSGITLSLFALNDRKMIFDVMRERREAGMRTVFDGNYRPRNWHDEGEARTSIAQAVSLATWSLPTFDDEQMLFGDRSPEETAARHLELGAHEVIVKHGANGALIDGTKWIRPPNAVVPRDTTGAGDSFNAGYVAARANGTSAEDAVLDGHRLAGRVLMVPGALLPRE